MLLDENKEIWAFWQKIQTQWRAGFSIIGLDYNSVLSVAKLYNIEITSEFFQKIQILEFDTLKEARERQKK